MIKPPISIPNKGQVQLGRLVLRQRGRLSPPLSLGVCQFQLFGREVAGIEDVLELGFEWGVDGAEMVPGDAVKEGVGFDFLGTVVEAGVAEAVGGVAEQAVDEAVCECGVVERGEGGNVTCG